MPTILCFGDSNTWGCVPGSFDPETGLSQRYGRDIRWPGVLRNEMGRSFEIVENAINGRTTNLNEVVPNRPFKNGLEQLLPALEINYPIDLVILMLGTNDVKKQFNRSAQEIGEGLKQLIQVVQTCNKGPQGNPPRVLIIAAQPIIKITNLHPMINDESIKKSEQLKDVYAKLAKEQDCLFLDASVVAKSSSLDGAHLDEEGHRNLGKYVALSLKK